MSTFYQSLEIFDLPESEANGSESEGDGSESEEERWELGRSKRTESLLNEEEFKLKKKRLGNLVFLSARPHVYKDVSESRWVN